MDERLILLCMILYCVGEYRIPLKVYGVLLGEGCFPEKERRELLAAFFLLAQLAMKFKSPEYFWLSLFGLTIIAGVSSKYGPLQV